MIKKYKKIIIRASIILIFLIMILLYLYVESINYVVNIVVISFLLSYMLRPLRDYICEKVTIKKSLAALLIILLTILSFVALIYCVVPALVKESSNLGNILDSVEYYVLSLVEKFKINEIPIFEVAYAQVAEKINIFFRNTSVTLVDNAIDILGDLVGAAIIPIISYYFLADGTILYNKFMLIFPTDKRRIIKKINNNIDKVLSKYIISQLLLSLIIGVLTFILLLFLNIKFSLILSVLNGIANIIPYFGPIIGGVPIVFIAFTISPSKGIMALIGILVIQQIEGNLLAPKITGDSTNMHPITIIILLIIGERVAGILGLILIVPIAVIIKVIYDDFNYYLF